MAAASEYGNWYCTRESVKRALSVTGSARNAQVDDAIEAGAREIEQITNRRFIPKTEKKLLTWPQRHPRRWFVLHLPEDLVTVTEVTKDDDTATVIPLADVLLEPNDIGPPYSRLEIDLSSSSFFSYNLTHQQAIRVTGEWGYTDKSVAAGTVAEAVDSSETEVDTSDGSLWGVGSTLLLDSEKLFVREKLTLDTTATLNATLAADVTANSFVVSDGTKVKVGEVVLVNSERMLVDDVVTNTLTVQRAYDGTKLAAHASADKINAYRVARVDRGVNGSTAATHLINAELKRYVPPGDIAQLNRALAIASYTQELAGWAGTIGSGTSTEGGAVETKMVALDKLRASVRKNYKRRAMGAV